ncbi:hypothetical protein EBT25_18055, partial [bacterium]|nr:hypothetical protein [bacterium]
KLRDMDMALKNIVKEFCEGELKDLRRQVQERENEIKALRNTNATKCVIGETLIMDTLRSIYTRSEIAHTGKQAHECDIHMTDSDNHLMIFESKYKNTITKQDVDKFYYDIQNQPAERAVIGAVFISLNTPNIPTKGDICIELANNTYTTIPILFVGFRTPEEFTMNFPAIVTMFTALCKYQYRVNAQKSNDDSKDATKDYEAKLQQILQEIDTVLALISSNKSRITELRKIATDLEENQKATLSCLSNIATSIDPQRATHSYNPIISNPKQPKTVYTCDKCKTATFTNKKELAKHGRICVNGPANTNTH